MSLTTATLALFHAILVEDLLLTIPDAATGATINTNIDNDILKKTVVNGYVLDPRIPATDELLQTVNKTIGLSGEKMNQAFHKSWQVIEHTPLEILVAQQITHYFTTYGLEQLGLYQQDLVYIPKELLEVPDTSLSDTSLPDASLPDNKGIDGNELLQQDLPILVIHAVSRVDLIKKILNLANGIALADETLTQLMVIIKALFPKADEDFIYKIDNRELLIRLQEYYQLLPSDPVEFLRFIVYRLTGESLLIKNDVLIRKIKQADQSVLDALIEQAPDNLASIFLRYKPLFLAMKSLSSNKHFFNRLRKDAVNLHQPMPEDYLNNITRYIKQGTLDFDVLAGKLKYAAIYRKIRLINALRYRLGDTRSIVYRVRNGRSWATEFEWDTANNATLQQACDLVFNSIVDDLRPKVVGKAFYIPNHIHYAIPATEKQYTGEYPTGSWVSVANDLIVGIHWYNCDDYRVDLDLASISLKGKKVGWDANYYSDSKDVLFSGDMTDAPLPKGASELFYFKKNVSNTYAMTVNYYNFSNKHPVDCSLFVASERIKKQPTQNYMVNPNNIIIRTRLIIEQSQNILNLVIRDGDEFRVYLANINLGMNITSTYNEHTRHAHAYLAQINKKTLMLEEVLLAAGANLVRQLPLQAELNQQSNKSDESFVQTLYRKILPKKILESNSSDSVDVDNKEVSTDTSIGINLAPSHITKHTFIELLTVETADSE